MAKNIDQNKPLDLICLGRIAVDLYAQQIGSRLEDATSFSKYLGGSSGNVAYGTAVQGLKSSMLARVGDEHMGRFLREELESVNCDTSHLITDKERLTGLVILGIKDQDTFPLIFYRENCADMAINVNDFTEEYIASSKALAITGTHLSNPKTKDAVIQALTYARKHNVRTLLDIDYRPVLWGLTALGDGETRFVDNETVTKELLSVLHYFDVIVGTEEEFHIAGGTTDTLQALTIARESTDAVLVCKRGEKGCSVFEHTIPNHIDGGLNVTGVRVDVLNVLGAGDAFMSGLLRGYINQEGWEQSCRYANACGALVVSRHGCAPAMPTKIELDNYLAREKQVLRPDQDQTLNHLHRVTTRKSALWSDLHIFAFDHRKQLTDMADQVGAPHTKIALLKRLLLKASQLTAKTHQLPTNQVGILADTTFGQQALNDATGTGCWIARPIEKPSSRPIEFEHGDLGSQLMNWPAEHIVKCLIFYHPNDDAALKAKQDLKIKEMYEACQRTGHQLLLEMILPADMDQDEAHYPTLLEYVYTQLGVKPDWWKLPAVSSDTWTKVESLIDQHDTYCQGIVILGLDAPLDVFESRFKQAGQHNKVKGFAVGRTIFGEPSKAWLAGKLTDEQLIDEVSKRYETLIHLWQKRTS